MRSRHDAFPGPVCPHSLLSHSESARLPARVGTYAFGKFFDFLRFLEHRYGKYLNGIGFFHLGFQFASQLKKPLDTFSDVLLVGLQHGLRGDLGLASVFVSQLWLGGRLRRGFLGAYVIERDPEDRTRND